MIQASVFGKTSDGRTVYSFKIRDGANEATILSLGGIIQSLKIAGQDGKPVDVVLAITCTAAKRGSIKSCGTMCSTATTATPSRSACAVPTWRRTTPATSIFRSTILSSTAN